MFVTERVTEPGLYKVTSFGSDEPFNRLKSRIHRLHVLLEPRSAKCSFVSSITFDDPSTLFTTFSFDLS